MAGGMLHAGEMRDPVEPDCNRFSIRVPYNHEFRTVAGVQIGRRDDADVRIAAGITPAQTQPVAVHDGQFVFAVQAAVNGYVVCGFHGVAKPSAVRC